MIAAEPSALALFLQPMTTTRIHYAAAHATLVVSAILSAAAIAATLSPISRYSYVGSPSVNREVTTSQNNNLAHQRSQPKITSWQYPHNSDVFSSCLAHPCT
jgi:hypothetical protein